MEPYDNAKVSEWYKVEYPKRTWTCDSSAFASTGRGSFARSHCTWRRRMSLRRRLCLPWTYRSAAVGSASSLCSELPLWYIRQKFGKECKNNAKPSKAAALLLIRLQVEVCRCLKRFLTKKNIVRLCRHALLLFNLKYHDGVYHTHKKTKFPLNDALLEPLKKKNKLKEVSVGKKVLEWNTNIRAVFNILYKSVELLSIAFFPFIYYNIIAALSLVYSKWYVVEKSIFKVSLPKAQNADRKQYRTKIGEGSTGWRRGIPHM